MRSAGVAPRALSPSARSLSVAVPSTARALWESFRISHAEAPVGDGGGAEADLPPGDDGSGPLVDDDPRPPVGADPEVLDDGHEPDDLAPVVGGDDQVHGGGVPGLGVAPAELPVDDLLDPGGGGEVGPLQAEAQGVLEVEPEGISRSTVAPPGMVAVVGKAASPARPPTESAPPATA